MNFTDWLASSIGTTTFLAIVGFLARHWIIDRLANSIKYQYERELETHKANLKRDYDVQIERIRAELAEKQFRFSHVFEKTATVITEIYMKFRHFENAVSDFQFAGNNPERRAHLLEQASKRRKELWQYVEMNKIFLPRRASLAVQNLYIAYYATTTTAMLADKINGVETPTDLSASLDVLNTETKNFLSLLEDEFQKILGFPMEAS